MLICTIIVCVCHCIQVVTMESCALACSRPSTRCHRSWLRPVARIAATGCLIASTSFSAVALEDNHSGHSSSHSSHRQTGILLDSLQHGKNELANLLSTTVNKYIVTLSNPTCLKNLFCTSRITRKLKVAGCSVDHILPGANAVLSSCKSTANTKRFVNTVKRMDVSFSTATPDALVALDIPEMIYFVGNSTITTGRRLWADNDEDDIDHDLLRRVMEAVPNDEVDTGVYEKEALAAVLGKETTGEPKEDRDLLIIFKPKTATVAPTPAPKPTCEKNPQPTPPTVSTADPYLCEIPKTTMTPVPKQQIATPWGLKAINVPDQPSTNPSFPSQGKGVWVWVLDTGIQPNHTEFSNRDVRCWSLLSSPDNSCIDENGHGTHVTGTAAGTTIGCVYKLPNHLE